MTVEQVVNEWPNFLVELLAEDIEIAHEINPHGWAIHTYRDDQIRRPALGVSQFTVLSFNDSNRVTFTLDRDQLDENTLGKINSISAPRELREPWIFSVSLPVKFIEEHHEELVKAHHSLVGRLARYNAQRRNEHRHDFVEAFSRRLGETLPHPADLAKNNRYGDRNASATSGPTSTKSKSGSEYGGYASIIAANFAATGLNYTDTQIADFYTALQTKGFVVLSGISGTGKSKIAAGFTDLLPDATITEVAGPDPVTAHQALQFQVSDSQTWAAVPADQSHLFPRINQNTRYDVDFVFEGGIYRGSYKTRTLNFGKPTLYLILGGPLTQRLRRAAGEDPIFAQFRAAPSEEILPRISISLEKPTPEVSTQEVETIEVSNTLFLSVRPDWRDSTSLLGYYNPLTQTYEWTDFLRFILNAADNYRTDNPIAWFVILDEMNLAHVEYYFADLLSVLESGRVSNPDKSDFGFTEEPLRITYPDEIVNDVPPSEVHLPPNLYIIGTVNMDETTHAFSPKVLDRAFTMELTEVDFTDYPTELDEGYEVGLADVDKQGFLQAFSQNGAFPHISKTKIRDYLAKNDDIRDSLQRLNAALAEHRFHFGYRVFDEIVQFLANAEDNQMYRSKIEALDSAAFMKILPKFSGSEARVRQPLDALIEWASNPFGLEQPPEPVARTLNRARYMQHILQTDGFVTAF